MFRTLLAVAGFSLLAPAAWAATGSGSITDTSAHWPTLGEFLRVLSLRDYNTRVVMLGSMLLGVAAGIIGSFALLRKRALMGDAVSHATLPGIALAFIVMTALGGTGKYLPGLLLGGLISGLAGMGLVLLIRGLTRLKEDVALGIVLSVFFGLGIALLGIIQKMKSGHAAGLESFIYGKTASMLASDAQLIGGAAVVVVLICALFFKEFALICFDQDYAGSLGWPVRRLDAVMMGLIVFVTVIGLQAVGLILVIALLIVPPAAARFWTNRLPAMVMLAAALGGASCLVGAGLSALMPRLPAGAIIVVVACTLFLFSMLFAPARGVTARWIEHWRLNRVVGRQHLLRSMFEGLEVTHPEIVQSGSLPPAGAGVPFATLIRLRSWSPITLRRMLRRAESEGLIIPRGDAHYALTEEGLSESRRVVRNHRLWETYLITHADVAPNHVDHGADEIEHVLGRSMVEKLEGLLAAEHPALPPSPHPPGN